MESEARKLCDMGNEFLDRGEPEEALRCYERAIDVEPENPDAWCGRGKAAYDLGRLERADRDFRRALRFAQRELGDVAEPANAKAKGRASRRWWSDASTRPYLRALHGHGLCRFWLGAYEDAARVFRKLLKLAPTDPLDVRFLVGETYLRMGRIERAVTELEKVEDDPDALYNLGLARFFQGDFPASVNAFRRGFFANLHLPPLLCEAEGRGESFAGGAGEGAAKPEGKASAAMDAAKDAPKDAKSKSKASSPTPTPAESTPPPRREFPSDAGTHPKGLDSEAAANDYLDRCGDFWFGRPVLQRWLAGIRAHAVVEAEVVEHLDHLRALGAEGLAAGVRARLEGRNTSLRSPARLAATDREIAAAVLARVFTLPPPAPPADAS